MILDAFTMHNFGVYRGSNTMQLTPPSKSQPVVLIGGLNGHGKTTLLDALHLVLYGKRARCSDREGLAYGEFLRQSVHHGTPPSDFTSLDLSFRHSSEGQEHTYRLVRYWYGAGDQREVRDNVEVWRDDALDPVMAERWDEQVEQFLPFGIAPLFLFDGEKIERLADPDQAAEMLRAALHGLLGLDLIDRLDADLRVFARRKRKSISDPEEHREIERAEQALMETDLAIQSTTQAIASLNNQIAIARTRLLDAERAFRREGGELFEQRRALENQQHEYRAQIHAAERALREIAATDTPLLLVRGLLEDTHTQAQDELEAGITTRFARLLAARDATLLDVAAAHGTDRDAVAHLRAHLAEDRARREQCARAFSPHLHLSSAGLGRVEALLDGGLAQSRLHILTALQHLERLEIEYVHLERKLEAVPPQESVEALITARERARADLTHLEHKHEQRQVEQQTLLRERDQRARHLNTLAERRVRAAIAQEDTQRMLDHARRSRETLTTFRRKVLDRHLGRIEAMILDSYEQLTRKTHLVSAVRINPRDFTIELRGRDDRPLDSRRLSAGERQLLAVSLLWGLAKASKRPIPAVIDTPLGRLDSSHRRALVGRYFPHASHQVLLLSTDEEIDERYYESLAPWVGRAYHLQHNDAEGKTSIHEGYFFELPKRPTRLRG